MRINLVEVAKKSSGINMWSDKMIKFMPKDYKFIKSTDHALADLSDIDLVYYNFYRRASSTAVPSVGLFTHIEEYEPGIAAKFFKAASVLDHIIVICQLYKDKLIEHGIDASKISVIPLGCELDIFKPKIKLGISARMHRSGRKGEKILSKFIHEASIPMEYLKLVIVGRDWLPWVEEHEKLIDIDYRDWVEFDEVRDMMQEIDYYLCMSLYEGQCIPLMEAYACGKPVISRLVGMVCNELEEAIIFDSHYDLDVILNRLIMDKRKSVEKYTWENYAAKHIAVFRATAKK